MKSVQFYAILEAIHKMEAAVYLMDDEDWLDKGALTSAIGIVREILREVEVKNVIKR